MTLFVVSGWDALCDSCKPGVDMFLPRIFSRFLDDSFSLLDLGVGGQRFFAYWDCRQVPLSLQALLPGDSILDSGVLSSMLQQSSWQMSRSFSWISHLTLQVDLLVLDCVQWFSAVFSLSRIRNVVMCSTRHVVAILTMPHAVV